jgi:hypothetical protein
MPIRQWFYFDAVEALPDTVLSDSDANYTVEVGEIGMMYAA